MIKSNKKVILLAVILGCGITHAEPQKSYQATQGAKDKATLIDLSKILLAGDVDALKDTAIDGVVSEGVGISKS